MHQVLNRHFTVQNSLLLKALARHPFHFPKHCFTLPRFHEPSMAVSGRYWGAGDKSCDGISPLRKDMILDGQSHSSSSSKEEPEQDSGRLSYTPQNEHLHFQPMKGKMHKKGDELSLVEASVIYYSDFFLCHGPTSTACRSEHLKNQFWN